MHKTSFIVGIAFTLFSVGTIFFIERESNKIETQIAGIEQPRFVVSKEPTRIANTLLSTYPYLKMWGPDVLYYWSCIIYDQCQRYGMPWELVVAKINCESGFNPKAISEMNAKGIAQMLDSTGAMTARELGITFVPGVTLYNDVSAMIMGIRYLYKGYKSENYDEDNTFKCYYGGLNWRKKRPGEDNAKFQARQNKINIYAENVTEEVKRIRRHYRRINSRECDTIPR